MHPSRYSTTGLCARCPLTRYCLYMRYPLSHATSSLGVPTSLIAHASFVIPPLALLSAVCPLHVVTASTIGSRSRKVRSLSRYRLSRTTPNSLTLPVPPSRYPSSRLAVLPSRNSTTAYAHDVLSRDTASTCGTCTRVLRPLSGYPPLTAHPSFLIPPLALLCAVCPLTW